MTISYLKLDHFRHLGEEFNTVDYKPDEDVAPKEPKPQPILVSLDWGSAFKIAVALLMVSFIPSFGLWLIL